MILDNTERARMWMQDTLTRAIQIERDAAEKRHELSPAAHTRRGRAAQPIAGDVESWYEPITRYPVEDPPNLLVLKLERHARKWKPDSIAAESEAA